MRKETKLALWGLAIIGLSGCGQKQQAGAERVGTVSQPVIWVEQDKLLASDGTTENYFGQAVALDGDTALVGAYNEGTLGESAGAVYELVRSAGTWTEQDKLLASDGATGDSFGRALALEGDTALVGAPLVSTQGAAYVLVRAASAWTEQDQLIATDGASMDFLGHAVALSGDTALVGAYEGENGRGSAYVFVRNAGVWTEQQELLASDGAGDDEFGRSVALDGDTALIGAERDDDLGNRSGAAYVFLRSASTWTEQDKLLAGDGAADDFFGKAVALDGDTALVGAPVASGQGAAYVLVRSASTWTEQDKLLPSDGELGDFFGASVSLQGDMALVGNPEDDENGLGAGAAYVFVRSASGWTEQQKLLPSDGASYNFFGGALALSGDSALVGASGDDYNGMSTGSAYVFILLDVGDPCTQPNQCASGFCVDGVCCDTPCGDGDTLDCVACSTSAGAAVDGICEPLADDTGCDDGVYCNGTETCTAGLCGDSSGDPCVGADGDEDCAESCDESGAGCDAADPDGSFCLSGICQSGSCEPQGTGGSGTGGSSTGGSGGAPLGEDYVGQGVDDDGCGCRLPGGRRTDWRWLPAGALGVAALRRRRRSPRTP